MKVTLILEKLSIECEICGEEEYFYFTVRTERGETIIPFTRDYPSLTIKIAHRVRTRGMRRKLFSEHAKECGLTKKQLSSLLGYASKFSRFPLYKNHREVYEIEI